MAEHAIGFSCIYCNEKYSDHGSLIKFGIVEQKIQSFTHKVSDALELYLFENVCSCPTVFFSSLMSSLNNNRIIIIKMLNRSFHYRLSNFVYIF